MGRIEKLIWLEAENDEELMEKLENQRGIDSGLNELMKGRNRKNKKIFRENELCKNDKKEVREATREAKLRLAEMKKGELEVICLGIKGYLSMEEIMTDNIGRRVCERFRLTEKSGNLFGYKELAGEELDKFMKSLRMRYKACSYKIEKRVNNEWKEVCWVKLRYKMSKRGNKEAKVVRSYIVFGWVEN